VPQESDKIHKPVKKPPRDLDSLPRDSPEVIAARLEEMERKIERLRSMYETFFSGVERSPPNAPRRELNRLMLETQQIQIRNAALRFRFQSLSQKWTLMTTYWNRTLREIEAGTYRKDVARVSRRLAQKGTPLSEQEAIALGIPASRARALVARQAKTHTGAAPPVALPGVAAPAQAEAPAAASVPGMNEAEIEILHRRYEEAARSAGGNRPAPSLANLKKMLAKKVPELLAQNGAARMAFDVAVEEGRVVLRPKPQR
jgi:hypothetical protein